MPDGAGGTTAKITAVVNTGDDMWLTGLRVCPDLDSVMYALAGVNDESRGWGRSGETERVSAELTAYGVGWPWFTLGDLDIGTHITRSHLLRTGLALSHVTRQLASRWDIGIELLPMSDEEVETQVVLDGPTADVPEVVHFEEWWVRYRAQRPAREFIQAGLTEAAPAPGVLTAISAADVVVLAPSNPVVSVGTIMNVPGIREGIQTTPAPVVGISPIISGAAVRGMAEACLAAVGVRTGADAVALHYGARSEGGVLDAWLIDSADARLSDPIARAGVHPVVVPLWMNDVQTSANLAAAVLDAASTLSAAKS
ncbi:2-phospho-L-lactate transferase [Arthrobacter nitrophenolicus]|nr:LPPG:FO 2-phospho-L-lactate transferase [Arthrobacter nitrophenolicus]